MRKSKWNKEKVLLEIEALHKKLGRRPVKRDNSNLYFLTRKFYRTWNNALRATGYTVKDFQSIDIPKLSEELAYFVGLVLTDGHLVFNEKRGNYSVRVYTSYQEEKEVIIRLIKHIIDYIPTIRGRKYGFNKLTNYEIVISSKKLVLFLHNKFNIPLGAKSNTMCVPTILTKNNRLFYSFLRGAIDGDGHIRRKSIILSSKSKIFLTQIQNKLNEEIYSRIEEGTTTNNLAIERQSDIRNLYSSLYADSKFFYKRKKETYDAILKSFINNKNV